MEGHLAVENALDKLPAGDISPLYTSDALKAQITLNNARGALDVVANLTHGMIKDMPKAMVKFYSTVAKLLLKDPDFNPKMKVVPFFTESMLKAANVNLDKLGGSPDVVRGLTTHEGVITLASKWGTDASVYVFMHEIMHARLAKYISMYLTGEKGGTVVWKGTNTAAIRAHIDNLNKLYRFTEGQLFAKAITRDDVYGLADLHEFVSEGWSNSSFMEKLHNLRLSPTSANGLGRIYASALDAFVGLVGKIFGVSDTPGKTVLESVHSETAKLLKAIDENEKGLATQKRIEGYGKEGTDWSNQLEAGFTGQPLINKASPTVPPMSKTDYLASLEGKVDPAMIRIGGGRLYDAYLKQLDKDNKPLNPPIGHSKETPEQVLERLYRKDGTRREDDVRPIGPGYTSSNLGNSIVRYAYDKISVASTQADNIFNKLFRGGSIVETKGFISPMSKVKRVEDPNSLAMVQKRIKGPDIANVLDLIMDSRMDMEKLSDPTFLRARGVSPVQETYIKALIKFNKDSLDIINKVRKEAGLEPIPYNKEHLLSNVRYGEYHVYQLDPTTNKHEFLEGYSTMSDAKKVSDHMNKTAGLKTIPIRADYNPRNMDIVPMDSFFQLSKVVTDPEARAIVKKALEDASGLLGVNKYGLRRDAAASTRASSKDLRSAIGDDKAWEHINKSLEIYAMQVAKYAGSYEARRDLHGLLNTDNKVKQDYPNAHARAQFMWEKYSGLQASDLDKAIEDTIKAYTDKMSKHVIADGVSLTSRMGIAAHVIMFNPAQWIASITQSAYMPARLYQISGKEWGGKGNMGVAETLATKHLWLPDSTSLEIYKYALDKGAIEARFAESMNWMQTESKVSYGIQYAVGMKLGAFADSRSRSAAVFVSYEYARSAGLTHQEALDFAVREAKGAMVDYEKWSRAPIFNRLGLVGDAAAPLTTFVAHTLAQTASFVKDATLPRYKQERIVKPLMVMLGTLVFYAGVKGLLGAENIAEGYDAFNEWLVSAWGMEPMATSNELWGKLPKLVQYGVPTTLSGVDVHNTFGMGQVTGMLNNWLGVKYLWNVGDALYTSIQAYLGNATTQETFQTLAKISPHILNELIRSILYEQSPLEPSIVRDKASLPVYERNQIDQIKALLTGRASLDEASAKADKFAYTNMSAALKEAASRAGTMLAESYLLGKDMPDFVEKVMDSHPEASRAIIESARQKYKEMGVDYETRQRTKIRKDNTLGTIFEGVYAD